MRRRIYGRGPTIDHTGEWRQQNIEMSIKRESKNVSYVPGPRYIAIKEYIEYTGENGENVTHEEKMIHVAKSLTKLGYKEITIKNAEKWIADFVNGVTNKLGQTIKKSGSQQGDDDDAR